MKALYDLPLPAPLRAAILSELIVDPQTWNTGLPAALPIHAKIEVLGGQGLPHQGLKARLHKMLVESQSSVHPCFAHDNERNAVH